MHDTRDYARVVSSRHSASFVEEQRFQAHDLIFGQPKQVVGHSRSPFGQRESLSASGSNGLDGPKVIVPKRTRACYKHPDVIKNLRPFLFLALCAGLFGCAPPDIPRDASRHWELKSGFFWTWSKDVEHGCVAWMAKREWADVQILIDSRCEGRRELGYLEGKGLTYFSASDHLVFKGYWPWTSDLYSGLIIFDDRGMIIDVLPCPYSLSPDQIDAMRVVVIEALEKAATDGERRVLNRVKQRLAKTNGAALSSSQEGCTDEPLDRNERASGEKVDPWIPR